MNFVNPTFSIIGVIAILSVLGFAYTNLPIQLTPIKEECGTEHTTNTTILVVGDSICTGKLKAIPFFSLAVYQLNPFWDFCEETNATVLTECHEGMGMKYFDANMDEYLDEHEPDVLVLQSYWNDVLGSGDFCVFNTVEPITHTEYKQHLASIADKADARGVSLVLVFGYLGDGGGYAGYIREFAVENGIAFIDLRDIKPSDGLVLDGVHPNQAGQDAIRRRLLEALK